MLQQVVAHLLEKLSVSLQKTLSSALKMPNDTFSHKCYTSGSSCSMEFWGGITKYLNQHLQYEKKKNYQLTM